MSMRVKHSLLWLLPMLLWAQYTFAFGAEGHRVIGYVADSEICASTRSAVTALLEGESLAQAGLWADQIRGYPEWDYAKPWHYMNVADDAQVQSGSASKPDVVWAIDEMLRQLQTPGLSTEQQGEALRFLIHFIADIHQPLHVGRREDRGGNLIKVTFNSADSEKLEKSNLHRYWDSDVIRISTTDSRSYAAKLQRLAVPQLRTAELGWPLLWAEESQALRIKVYDFQGFSTDEVIFLGPAYRTQSLSVLAQRLTLAGLRLAATLDDLYCDAVTGEQESAPLAN